jgi:hypothetical protein
MYHAIVKRIARKNFERVNQKEFDALFKDCVPDIHHRFYGSHALSGERNDREALSPLVRASRAPGTWTHSNRP